MKMMVIVLTSVMTLSGLVLAAASALFAPQIEAQRAMALNRSLMAVFPEGDTASFEEIYSDAASIYKGTDSQGALLGFAVAIDTPGYGGTISLLVRLSPDLETIRGIAIVENVETPGLGARIEEDWFRWQFAGLNTTKKITYVKNRSPDPAMGQIEAISGATISTKAVLSGLNSRLAEAVAAIKDISIR